MRPLTRRNFLKGIAGSSLALPMLPSLHAHAQQGVFPTRLLIVFSANGSFPNRWDPSGTERNWTITPGDILEPLIPVKDDIIVVRGVDMTSTNRGIGDGHQKGMVHMLTGAELLPGPFQGGGNAGTAGYASRLSVDQHIAKTIHNGEKFDTLTLAVKAGNPTNWSRMSYTGPDSPVTPRDNPSDVFSSVFSDIDLDPFDLERLRLQKQSVLDFIGDDLDRIKNKVAAKDLARIDEHLTSIRTLEQQLNSGNEFGVCNTPDIGNPLDHTLDANFGATGQLMMDMIVKAFACNLTRVATLQWSRSVSNVNYSFTGVDARHHDLSHEGDENAQAVQNIVDINRFHATQFKYLIDEMKAIPEGNGTMLDNTCIIWVNELGKGNSHTRNNVPYVLAGNCGGYFETGRYLQYGDDPHNNMLLSLCHAMGVNDASFGDPDFCTGPLANLRGNPT